MTKRGGRVLQDAQESKIPQQVVVSLVDGNPHFIIVDRRCRATDDYYWRAGNQKEDKDDHELIHRDHCKRYGQFVEMLNVREMLMLEEC